MKNKYYGVIILSEQDVGGSTAYPILELSADDPDELEKMLWSAVKKKLDRDADNGNTYQYYSYHIISMSDAKYDRLRSMPDPMAVCSFEYEGEWDEDDECPSCGKSVN